MADIQKPVVPTEATTVEPTPAPPALLPTDKPAEVVEPTIEEPAKKEEETVAPVVAEEKKEEVKHEEKPVEPIYSGALGYKAPGLKNAFRFSKKYFWFGEEPVPTQSLSHYLRGEKAEVAHPTAAWSSHTGKGLLYFVKHADDKATPAGVLNLADAENVVKDGTIAFHFKLHGQKHTFEAQNLLERNGWFVAVEKAVVEAKASKDSIVSSEAYKEELAKLGKPATLAATAAKEGSTPKKSTDGLKPVEAEPVVAEGSTPVARAGSSSSSSSSDEDKKKKKSKSKSRSVSRGKRASIFGGFLGKKEKTEEKAEEKKEEKKEGEIEAKKEEPTAIAPLGAPEVGSTTSTTAPVIPAAEPIKPIEEIKPAEPIVPAAAAPVTEEKKIEEKPKPAKRGSIFGNFAQKLKSPTTEKKESELVPAVPAKEPETTTEAPKVEETPAVAATAPVIAPVDGVAEAPKEEKKEETKPVATTPHKEKQHFSFGKFLGGAKEKVKSPTEAKNPLEVAKEPKVEEPAKTDEAPIAAPTTIEPAAPVAEAPKEEKKEEETPVEATSATTTPATQQKRGSIFGNLGGSVKKEKDGEDKPKGLLGLFRNASKAGRSKKEKEPTTTPAKVDETTEPKEETPAVPVTEDKKEETPAAPVAATEPTTIGDVVPDAVTVGQAPKSTQQVSTTA